LKGITKRFRKYTEEKGLILSSEKSKVIVFERGGRRCFGEREWKWYAEKIEVKKMRYL